MREELYKVLQARFQAMRLRPYLTTALMNLILIESEMVETMAVDAKWRCYYNPAFVEERSIQELAVILLHEVYHLLRDHHRRMTCYPYEIAGLATDMAVNNELRQEGLTLPADAILPEKFGLESGWTAEQYAEALLKRFPLEQFQQSGSEGPSAGAGNEQGEASSSNETAGDAQPSAADSNGAPVEGESSHRQDQDQQASSASAGDSSPSCASPSGARPMAGRSGSCAYPYPEPWELKEEGEGVSDIEAELIRREVAKQIQEQKDRGKIPAHWVRWADEILAPPRVDWRKELATVVRRVIAQKSGADDYSRRRPSRRQTAIKDVVLPGLIQPVPTVAVLIDTSGSMSDSELATAISAVANIIQQIGVPIRVVTVDAAVHGDVRIVSPRQLKDVLVGGGGTDLREGFNHLEQNHPPDAVIVITDGWTPWPAQKPRWSNTIVVLTDERQRSSVPAWAKTICMDIQK